MHEVRGFCMLLHRRRNASSSSWIIVYSVRLERNPGAIRCPYISTRLRGRLSRPLVQCGCSLSVFPIREKGANQLTARATPPTAVIPTEY